jgi:hypothetical protein
MRGCYSVRFAKTTLTAANGDYDLFELNPAADEPIELYGLWIGNKTEVGDTQEEMVRYQILRFEGATLTSGNGASITPEPLTHGDEAASFAAEGPGSTIATSTGTNRVLHEDTFNIRTGLQLPQAPEFRYTCLGTADSVLIVRMVDALADDADLSATCYVRQLS